MSLPEADMLKKDIMKKVHAKAHKLKHRRKSVSTDEETELQVIAEDGQGDEKMERTDRLAEIKDQSQRSIQRFQGSIRCDGIPTRRFCE